MIRYFAFIWSPSDPIQLAEVRMHRSRLLETDPSWSLSFEGDGMSVLSAGTAPGQLTLLPESCGIIIGPIFPRGHGSNPTPTARLGGHDGSTVIRTGGERLIHAYWGSYVAFLCPATGRPAVLAAPFGSLPCYTAAPGAVRLFFSRTEDLLQLDIPSFSVNWECLLAHVGFNHIYSAETAIQGISQVMPGERVIINGVDLQRSLLWNPLTLRDRSSEDFHHLVQEVHETLKTSTHALAGQHSHILHELSGGLDSSIVLACLTDAPTRPAITCLNQHSAGINGDERSFARLASENRACKLMEIERDPTVRFENMLMGVRTANPVHHLHDLMLAEPSERLAAELGATAISTGTFGDTLFYRRPARVAAAEYLCRHGIDREFLRVVFRSALLDHSSMWQVLRYAVRHRLQRNPMSYWSVHDEATADSAPDEVLITAGARAATATSMRFLHPWFHHVGDTSIGRLWQAVLTAVVIGDTPFAKPDSPQSVHPMMNQLLAEICLATPVYMHLRGGFDRALARQAFAAELPAPVIQRMTKGTPDAYMKDIFVRNLPFTREILLDGRLVREGVLDRKKLERVLRREPQPWGGSIYDITGVLSKEIWLLQWTDTTASRAT